jgi:membrane-associated phospholipid phosphatase
MEYLLALQNLRNEAPIFINIIILIISEFIVVFGILFPAIVYWCVDKNAGGFMLFANSSTVMLNQVIKNTACIYRPWILDSRLEISPYAIGSASGYSFPSGHTVMGGTIYGTTAVWQRKKKYLVIFLIIMAFLTAFSRNWLGAHTLTDVSISLLESFFMILISYFLFKYLEVKPHKDIFIFIIFLILSVGGIIWTMVKSYPIDYSVTGEILVDPYEMKIDCWGAFGMIVGFLLGWILERKFIKFDVFGTKKEKILRFLIGALSLGILYLVFDLLICRNMGEYLKTFTVRFLAYFYVAGGFPFCIKLLQKKKNKVEK